MQVVGIDTWEPSLKLAGANIAAEGLADRLRLRRLNIADLDDERAFELLNAADRTQIGIAALLRNPALRTITVSLVSFRLDDVWKQFARQVRLHFQYPR